MPPRHAYWTILVDNQATAFRAHDAEELLPTLNRLREKNPSAILKWFERGQLFDSREAAREQGFGRGERRWEGPRPDREEPRGRGERPPRKRPAPEAERSFAERPANADTDRPRNRDWRPGGEHRDPRQKYQDAKKAKWQRFKKEIRERHERRQDESKPLENRPDRKPPFDPNRQDRWRPKGPPRERNDRDARFSKTDRPPFDPNRQDRWRPKGPPRERNDRDTRFSGKTGKPPFDPNRTDRWRPKGPPRERNDRDTRFSGKTGKPPFDPNRPPRKPWGAKPGGARGKKPWGAKPGGPARKPWAGDRDRRPEPRGDRRPPNGPRGPKREWRADGPPKRRKDEDE
jgi:hypothetical protein